MTRREALLALVAAPVAAVRGQQVPRVERGLRLTLGAPQFRLHGTEAVLSVDDVRRLFSDLQPLYEPQSVRLVGVEVS